jgi:hypothetical protein
VELIFFSGVGWVVVLCEDVHARVDVGGRAHVDHEVGAELRCSMRDGVEAGRVVGGDVAAGACDDGGADHTRLGAEVAAARAVRNPGSGEASAGWPIVAGWLVEHLAL